MPHMTHNYMLGLIALVVSFLVCFYIPLAIAWISIRKQKRKQNK